MASVVYGKIFVSQDSHQNICSYNLIVDILPSLQLPKEHSFGTMLGLAKHLLSDELKSTFAKIAFENSPPTRRIVLVSGASPEEKRDSFIERPLSDEELSYLHVLVAKLLAQA